MIRSSFTFLTDQDFAHTRLILPHPYTYPCTTHFLARFLFLFFFLFWPLYLSLLNVSIGMKKRNVLTAIRGFMSASAMPLSSVTPWKVDRSHLYPREKQGDIRAGPPRRRDGGLSRVRVIQSCETIPSLPPRPHASLFFRQSRNIYLSRSHESPVYPRFGRWKIAKRCGLSIVMPWIPRLVS